MATDFPISANTRPAINSIDHLIAALRKTGREAGMTEKDIDDMISSTRRGATDGVKHVSTFNQSFDKLNGTISKVSGTLVAFFAVDRIMAFGREVVNITGEFQKLEAVLENTLGSKSKARLALIEIARFAAQTPFAIKELTDSFVKLANQGFVPTREELRKLGDIAASTGKEFIMLTEAIIDAQVGEFERLKEFGIRASKEGDQVTFTFKGVETQVEFTTEAIKNYILSLGDAEGVTGAMAKISETLAGQISNAGDNFDTFFNNLGKYNKGPIGEFFRLFNAGMSEINDAMSTANMTAGDLAEIPLKRFRDAYTAATSEVEKSGTFEKLNQLFIDLTEAINSVNEDIEANADLMALMKANGDEESEVYKKLKTDLEIYNSELEGYKEIRQDLTDYTEDYKIKLKQQTEEAEKAASAERLLMQMMQARLDQQNREAMARPVGLPSPDVPSGDEALAAATSRLLTRTRERDKTEWAALYAEERKRIANDEFSHRMLVEQAYYDASINLAQSIFEYRKNRVDEELAYVTDARAKELELAGDNAESREAINKKFDERERQLRKKQAQEEQAYAIFSILVNQGPAVAQTIKNLGFPAAIPFVGLVLAQFALALSQSRSAKYAAEGEYDIEGPGTETSDSVGPYWLSRGESVTPARATRRFGFLLKPMIDDPNFDLFDLKRLVDQRIPTDYAKIVVNKNTGADSPEMLDELRRTRRALENQKQLHVTIDENGFRTSVREGDKWVTYVNNRYKF